jgi:hypothetical protein
MVPRQFSKNERGIQGDPGIAITEQFTEMHYMLMVQHEIRYEASWLVRDQVGSTSIPT